MINPIWLNTFVTLVDTGHFTKTAEKLFMTQPGVSQHINKLEQVVGHLLVRRENRKFDLTEQGRLVYLHAKNSAKQEEKLFEQLSFDDPNSGHCALACSGALALNIYPKLLDLQASNTGLVVQLKAAPNHQILHEINKGNIDLGIVTDVPNKNLFDVENISQEELCLVLPPTQKLKKNKEKDLNHIGLISHPDAAHYLSLYFAQCQETTFSKLNIQEIPITGYINQISQILIPVTKGLGFAVLPKSAIDCFDKKHLLTIYKSKAPVIETLYIVTKKNRVLPARYTNIKTTIKKLLA